MAKLFAALYVYSTNKLFKKRYTFSTEGFVPCWHPPQATTQILVLYKIPLLSYEGIVEIGYRWTGH